MWRSGSVHREKKRSETRTINTGRDRAQWSPNVKGRLPVYVCVGVWVCVCVCGFTVQDTRQTGPEGRINEQQAQGKTNRRTDRRWEQPAQKNKRRSRGNNSAEGKKWLKTRQKIGNRANRRDARKTPQLRHDMQRHD